MKNHQNLLSCILTSSFLCLSNPSPAKAEQNNQHSTEAARASAKQAASNFHGSFEEFQKKHGSGLGRSTLYRILKEAGWVHYKPPIFTTPNGKPKTGDYSKTGKAGFQELITPPNLWSVVQEFSLKEDPSRTTSVSFNPIGSTDGSIKTHYDPTTNKGSVSSSSFGKITFTITAKNVAGTTTKNATIHIKTPGSLHPKIQGNRTITLPERDWMKPFSIPTVTILYASEIQLLEAPKNWNIQIFHPEQSNPKATEWDYMAKPFEIQVQGQLPTPQGTNKETIHLRAINRLGQKDVTLSISISTPKYTQTTVEE